MAEAPPLQQIDRTYVRHLQKKLSYFSGCDYFRLSSHPLVLRALARGLEQYGLNVAASRQTTGNHTVYLKLENAMADFFEAENVLLTSSGYLTNLVVAQALVGNFSHALVDQKAHPSLLDAARFLDCPVMRFHHCDPDDLMRCVQRCGPEAKLILLTDGMFSHSGAVAPLAAYLKRLPKDALLLVDDAHGAGLLGATGKGSLEHEGVGRRRIIQTITLSKAFGVYGGAVLGSPALRKRMVTGSTLFIASTPLPLPLAQAALTSVAVLRSKPSFRNRLARNAQHVRATLRKTGLALPDAPGPILPLELESAAAISSLRKALLAHRIYPPFIRYPSGPERGYFRFVISSEHTPGQLNGLIEALASFNPKSKRF